MCNNSAVHSSSVTIAKGQWYYYAYSSLFPNSTDCSCVKWYSDDSSIASVNETTGYIYGVDIGTTRIYATTCDRCSQIGYITVTVIAPIPVTGISLSATSLTMNAGDTEHIYKTIYPANATDQKVTWESSDTSVAAVNLYRGVIHAKSTGIATITATTSDGEFTASCEVWVTGKRPVFLIHGRTSNSKGVWGINNDITEGMNAHFNPDINALSLDGKKYTDVSSQTLGSFEPNSGDDDADYPRNLGNELLNAGYKKNISLFAFNYPNEDAVVHSAEKFKKYIENLISYVRGSGSGEMKACFYASRNDYTNNNYKINIVGHSMGGLVARYYIENLGQDNHVEKLITICTPHWGSDLADYSTSLSIMHVLCDHDLDPDSEMYGGTNKNVLHDGCPLWDITDIWTDCTDTAYETTQELLYSKNRETKYYAIAGLDYAADYLYDKNIELDISTNFSTYQQLSDFMFQNKVYKLLGKDSQIVSKINLESDGDNVVSLLSQIGWTVDSGSSPRKRIQMEKILVILDSCGGNDLVSHLHGKIPHRESVISNTLQFLSE